MYGGLEISLYPLNIIQERFLTARIDYTCHQPLPQEVMQNGENVIGAIVHMFKIGFHRHLLKIRLALALAS